MDDGFVQLRYDNGGLIFKKTIKEAFEAADKDLDIWKISWTDSTSGERVRLIRRSSFSGDEWVYEPILSGVADVD